ncbi:CoA transferase [Variovorax sp. J31P179]|uniref:CaiB/BaiF CoA transferase family protein n=1 Tax=Variovorax sp. J31P179 TaxID=3053508 RepID=UPI002574DE93|nr:CoA transferase [Variovorax sp. J31P179]MDM0085363.1 CoA transferase [Variovorax sp. J31P179]
MSSERTAGRGPLDGVRVLDFTSVVMGPYATQLLASLGAIVTKVEPPGGDTMRHVAPMRNAGMGQIFLQANQGKRSIVLDLKQKAAQSVALRLASETDILISNVRPLAMARLGLDYETVRATNPRLIYISCVGFGQDGPYSARPAYDDLIQSAVGIPGLMKQYGAEAPCYVPLTISDRVAGLHAVYAATAALYERERDGGIGQQITVPMFEVMTQFVLGDHLGGHTFVPSEGDVGYARLLTPNRRPYQTKDGLLAVIIYNDKQWSKFFEAIGQPGRIESDARFSSHRARSENIDEVYLEVSRLMATRSTAEWQKLLDLADIPNMRVNTLYDVLEDPHHKATGFIKQVRHPTEGDIRVVSPPVKWSKSSVAAEAIPAPRLGEHSVDILREVGYSALEIATMQELGVCYAAK